MFAKRSYQHALRKAAKRLSLQILRTASREGHSARPMPAVPIAASWLEEWPLNLGDSDYKHVNPTAAQTALHAFSWWLIYQTEAVANDGDHEAALNTASACIPDAATGHLIGHDDTVLDDEGIIWPITLLLTGREPEPSSPYLISAHYIVTHAYAATLERRQQAVGTPN